ncbi:MAG: heterodisulfide reductase-related iron-sulfur binding cluster [Acidimicrobiales bacterium]
MSTRPKVKAPLKPSHLFISVGVLLAVGTAVSGIVGTANHFEDKSAISRPLFVDIPSPLKLVFYSLLPVLFFWAAWQLSLRAKNWERGAPDRRVTSRKTAKKRVDSYRKGVYMQTLLRDSAAGLMHSLIYFPFLILFAVTNVLLIDEQMPPSAKFLHGTTYEAYKFVGDTAGWLFLLGVGWAIVRRYIQRPYRLRVKTRPEDALILGSLFTIGITGLATQMFRIALIGRPGFEKWGYVAYRASWLVKGFSRSDLSTWHQSLWVVHVLAFFVFVAIVPITKMRHMFTSPMNMYLSDRDRPKGAMKPLPNLAETELESFGANLISDFTWKQLLDTDACTVCGRCTSVCPANATGKPLDPREIVLKVGHVMSASGSPAVPPIVGQDSELTVTADSVFERISAEEIWACTSCKACDEICPVNIEILDKILDMRRYLSLMESNFPTELGKAYRSMENQQNPWGMGQETRADWAPDDVPVVDGSAILDHEYLFWVGCAGSFDDKAKKISAATAKLLTRAGIDFAILGPSELCTGDPARRSGSEYIFQMLAMQNVETLNAMGVKKIITICPHCFNTLGNEYPQLGGHYEVVHHSQFLEWLIATGKLDLGGASLEEKIVYHDSCYLGRHNDVYAAPRNVIGSLKGIEIIEAPRNGTKGMCCGAGGARMWMEENTGKKVNTERSRELIATGAQRVATACPFCIVMLDDGVKENGRDDIVVADIAMHLIEAIEGGEARRQMAAVGTGTQMHQPEEHGANDSGLDTPATE